MYYFDDVKRYYEYAYNAEMRKQILNYENDEISLDYNQKPLGIAHRVQRLYPIYRDVPFSEDISSEIASKSHDKKINDIIRSLKEYIITMKEQAMEDAIAKTNNVLNEILTLKLVILFNQKNNKISNIFFTFPILLL